MNGSNFYIFKNNKSEEFIYSGLTNLILAYNDRVKKLFGERTKDDELEKILFGAAKENPSFEKKSFDTLVLFVTNHCNLACSYCFERAGGGHNRKNMDLETLKRSIIYFLKNFDHPGVIKICFFGGEPLLNLSLLKESIPLFNDLAVQYQVRFAYALATNGTIMNDEILDFLIKNDINVQVGMDGLETTHNLYRKFIDGRDTYQTVVANVKKLAEYCEVSARITITDFNLDLLKTYSELTEIGFSEVKMECVSDGNFNKKQSIAQFANNLGLFADYFIENIQQQKLINFAVFMMYLKKIHLGSHWSCFPCKVGISQYTVATDGSIYLCHRFNNCPESKCGDIERGLDNEKRLTFLNEHQKFNRSNNQCGNCWAQSLCGGTCYHASYTNSGDTRQISGFHCEYWKLIFAKVLYIYTSLTEEEKVFLNNIRIKSPDSTR
jgi:uncharacterized protein